MSDGTMYEEHALSVLIGTVVGLVVGGAVSTVWMAAASILGRRRG
jgi:hypothetical protein